jgi:hypothetical protein
MPNHSRRLGKSDFYDSLLSANACKTPFRNPSVHLLPVDVHARRALLERAQALEELVQILVGIFQVFITRLPAAVLQREVQQGPVPLARDHYVHTAQPRGLVEQILQIPQVGTAGLPDGDLQRLQGVEAGELVAGSALGEEPSEHHLLGHSQGDAQSGEPGEAVGEGEQVEGLGSSSHVCEHATNVGVVRWAVAGGLELEMHQAGAVLQRIKGGVVKSFQDQAKCCYASIRELL